MLASVTALVFGLVPAGPALAVTVNLRIEGDNRTIFDGQVQAEGRRVDGRPCDGTNNNENRKPGATVTTALDDGAARNNFSWDGTWNQDFEDFLIDRIGPDKAGNNKYWWIFLNYKDLQVGGCQQQVDSGDEILFAFDGYGKTPLKLSAPAGAEAGQSFTVKVTDGSDGDGVGGARVAGRETNGDGNVTLRYDSAGRARLQATKSGAVRSNAKTVCVRRGNDNCDRDISDPPPAGPLTGAISGPLVARISGLVAGRRYPLAAAPRVLRGDVLTGGAALTSLRIRLRRNAGGVCSHYSLRLRRFHPSRCVLGYFFYPIAATPGWSYTLPTRLLPGTYTLELDALDAAGRRSRARLVFFVLVPGRR